MKKNLLAIVFTFTLISSVFSQSGWIYQNPAIPILKTVLNDTYFINDLTGWVGGKNLMKTTDGGISWSIQLQSYISINAIFMITPDYGYICGQSGQMNVTVNGGTNWILLSPVPSGNFKDMYFTSALTGYVVSDSARISKTTNGGVNWTSKRLEYNSYTGIQFINDNTGFIFTKSTMHILKTTDAGENWSFIATPFAGSNKGFFINEQTGYAAGNTIWRTTDGGTSWAVQPTGAISNYKKIKFINSTTGFALGSNGAFRVTTNGGEFWSTTGIPANSATFTGISFSNQSTGYLCDSSGYIYKTTDAGQNWINLRKYVTEKNLKKVHFINPQTGWTAGEGGTLLNTTNGGTNWVAVVTGTVLNLNSVYFVNSQTGWISGNSGLMYKTTSGGTAWMQQTVGGATINLNKLYFSDENTGWVSDGSGKLYKTTNGGNNWVINFSSGAFVINDFQFKDANTGWLIGEYNTCKTTNGGTTWSLVLFDDYSNNSISFVNAQTGFVGSGSGLKKTTNGGQNWFSIYSAISFFNVKFINALTGFGDYIYKTVDGGAHWFDLRVTIYSKINSFTFVNENTGWAVGDAGAIMKTTDGGNVFVTQSSTAIPDNFYLKQNYPNPFNPTTTIYFQIPKNNYVSLKVFDINGREISELVNENLNAGEYKINFDGSALPSGVYYYKLTSDNFSETKKMILIK